MEKVKKIVLWCLTVFCLLISLGFMLSVSSFLALAIAVIIMPIPKWQDVLGKLLKGKVKVVVCVVLAVVMVAVAPTVSQEKTTTKAEETTESTTVPSTTGVVSSETATEGDDGNTTEVVTDAVSEDVQSNTTEKTTEIETQATTETNTVAQPVVSETEPVHTHNFKSATCTTPKTCTSCGATEGSANGHSWKDATCTSAKTCSVCGESSGASLGHNYSNGKCNRCGASDPNYVNDPIVWVPADGNGKYHSKSNCSGMVNPQSMTQSEAINQGYDACKRCH